MMIIFILILGIILSSIGLFFCILYISLLGMGYSLIEYFKFIITCPYTSLLFIGLLIIIFVLERKNIYEFLSKCASKFLGK